MAGKESSISVTVRVRPFTERETQLVQHSAGPVFLGDGSLATAPVPVTGRQPKGIRKIISVVDDKMLIFDPPEGNPLVSIQKAAFPTKNTGSKFKEHRFVFDRLFDQDSTQHEVFNHTSRPLIANVLDGYNATVFAYGATGCGKTHTISGTLDDPGIIFQTAEELFQRIQDLRQTRDVDVTLSYLEIYNETIRDLLDPSIPSKSLVIREDADKRISVSNLSSQKPKDVHEVMQMILQGNQNRTMSPTEANATSSRSHAVLQINVTQRERGTSTDAQTFGTLSLIDLAGSERAAATRNSGERLIEGANINKSLLALGNCINALCDTAGSSSRRPAAHVPYRNSKLTRLLQFSLGGNCKTVMIVCISPSSAHYDETLNTLKYANRAKEIKTKVLRNEQTVDRHVGAYLRRIQEQVQLIESLKAGQAAAVNTALEKERALRTRCTDALAAAVSSLEATVAKTAQQRAHRSQCRARMRALESQSAQIALVIQAYEATTRDSRLASVVDQLRTQQARLHDEQTALDQLYASLQDQNAFESSVAMLSRRLQETEGWLASDTAAFEAQCQVLRMRADKALADEETVSVPASLQVLAQLYFNTVAQLADSGTEPAVLSQQLVQAGLDLLRPEAFAASAASFAVPSPGMAPPSSSSSLMSSSSRRTSTPVASSSSRRQSARTSMRQSLGLAAVPPKRRVVVRSPKKSVKRVRWDVDGGSNSSPALDRSLDTIKLTFSPPRNRQTKTLPAMSSDESLSTVEDRPRRFGPHAALRRKSTTISEALQNARDAESVKENLGGVD